MLGDDREGRRMVEALWVIFLVLIDLGSVVVRRLEV